MMQVRKDHIDKLLQLNTDKERLGFWQSVGFSLTESEAMVKGYTRNGRVQESGGIWKTDLIEWCQAESKDHAIKLYFWNFGLLPDETYFVA